MDDITVTQAAQLLGVEPIKLPDGGYLLYVPADPALRRPHVGRTSIDAPTMGAAEFTAWMEDAGLDPAAAAAKLSEITGTTYTRDLVYQFRNGKRPVPARVRLALASTMAPKRSADVVNRLFAR